MCDWWWDFKREKCVTIEETSFSNSFDCCWNIYSWHFTVFKSKWSKFIYFFRNYYIFIIICLFLSLENYPTFLFSSFLPRDLISLLFCSQFSPVSQSCPTLCDPMNRSTPGLPVHHQLPEFTQTPVHQVSDAIQPSHPLSSPSPPAPSPSQHQSLFQWVNSSHEVAKVLEFQL